MQLAFAYKQSSFLSHATEAIFSPKLHCQHE